METQHIFRRAREAARALNRTASERIDRLLLALADAVEADTEELLAANARDRSRMNPADPAYDRLLLDRGRLLDIAADLRNVAALPSPLGRILDCTVRPNGMEIRKLSVPFGVVGVIYEARPNVGFDVFALCVKSGNACILKGGSDARDSNAAIAALIRRTLAVHGFDENALALLPPTHEATAALLGATGLVDLVIPRGGRGLIDFVRDHARVPVIETGAGVCHAYFDRSGDTEKGAAIVLNAKTRRVSVCNALDTLVVHRDRLTDLPRLCHPLAERGVELQADEAALAALHGNYPAALLRAADAASFGTEFLSLRLSIRTVSSLDEALAHIARYSSQHSETIIAEDAEAIRTFQREVDAACVYANVSTAFTDGAQFGMGAEIGISTQKLHARGPMALRELTSYKYLIAGDGQTRPSPRPATADKKTTRNFVFRKLNPIFAADELSKNDEFQPYPSSSPLSPKGRIDRVYALIFRQIQKKLTPCGWAFFMSARGGRAVETKIQTKRLMLRIAIQAKGRLNEQSLGLLLEAGIAVAEGKRRLIARAEGFPLEVLFLRDDDIPQAVSMGVADLGIVGQNEVTEKGYDVEQAMPLGFGACRLSLAVPNTADYTGPDYFRGRRVATSYPNILRGYFARQGIEAEIHTIEGSVEIAPAVGLSDAIFDIVSSGGTLVSNGLREVETVLRSEAALIACPSLDADKRSQTEQLVFRFRSIRESRDMKYVLMNLPVEKVAEATALLPGMRSPTILPLAQEGWCSLHAVIGKAQLWERIERLKAIGAEGILVLALENMIR